MPRRQRKTSGGTKKDKLQDKEIRELKKMVKPEMKYLDHIVGLTTFGANWLDLGTNGNNITASNQGLTANTRIGNSILVHSIQIKMLLFKPGLTTTTLTLSEQPSVRLVLFINHQTNQAATDYSLMWSSTASQLNMRNKGNKNFVFLHDQTYVMDNASLAHSDNTGANLLIVGRQRKYITIKHNFNTPLKILANNTTDVIGSYNDKTIGLSANSSSTTLQYEYQARVFYTDA